MIEQAMMRYFFVIILMAGLIILCFTLSDRPWLVGVVMILVGAVIGGPLWWWHFDKEAERRETERLRPEAARQVPSKPAPSQPDV